MLIEGQVPTIAAVLRRRGVALPNHFDHTDYRTYPARITDLAIEIAEAVRPRIETEAQLNAPELSGWGTLIIELHHPSDDCVDQNCWVVPVVWEMVNQVGWMCHNPRRDDETPHLPCRVLYRPND